MPPTRNERGFALPVALTASALLLISSLSIQSLGLHARQRSLQALTAAERGDRADSAAMEFLQQAQGNQACLLGWSSQQWDAASVCPTAEPDLLRRGGFDDLPWRLNSWDPRGTTAGILTLLWSDGVTSRQWLEVAP